MKTKTRFDIVGAHGCAPFSEPKTNVNWVHKNGESIMYDNFKLQCKGGQPSAPTVE
jgi:hypothetical protein